MSEHFASVTIPKKAFLPCYHHLLNSDKDIDFLWGGRDSGKSWFIASILLYSCLKLPYFRCILVRKVFNTIKESQWQLLKDVAIEWGIDHLFTFKENPLEITCVNGNRFICRGMDSSGKIKSIANPSHAWIEEGNQLDLDDFIILMTSLRTNSGRAKVWFSFNPECPGDFHDYWLYKTFFSSNMYNFNDKWKIKVRNTEEEFNYQSTHTTYLHNKYCKGVRIAFLEQLADIDPYYYTVFTLGKWGNRRITDPFCYCFDKGLHIKETKLNRGLELNLSFDFNVNPITCGAYQHLGNNIWGIESIKLENSNIYNLCDLIMRDYNGCMFQVTGDATGRNTNALVQDAINYYTVIKNKLDLSIGQLKVPTVNPKIEENRVLVNAVFKIMHVEFDPVRCKDLIFDCTNVGVTDVGKIDKGDRKDPVKRADHLDHFRYYCNTFHGNVIKF